VPQFLPQFFWSPLALVEDPKKWSKFLANPISHGKNFRGVFLDVFSHPEFKAEVRLQKYSFLPKILN